MKYLKAIILEFIILISITLVTTILYYFDIISSNINNVFKIITFLIMFIVSGIYIAKNSNKKYYLEGLKLAGINILLFLLLSLLFKYKFNIKQVIYYLLLAITVVLSSIMGGNMKKKK